MKKLILASVSAIALFGIAACSDSTDSTTTQSTTPPVEQVQPSAPATGTEPTVVTPKTDGTTTQSIDPKPETSTGGEMQNNELDGGATKPVQPAQ